MTKIKNNDIMELQVQAILALARKCGYTAVYRTKSEHVLIAHSIGDSVDIDTFYDVLYGLDWHASGKPKKIDNVIVSLLSNDHWGYER